MNSAGKAQKMNFHRFYVSFRFSLIMSNKITVKTTSAKEKKQLLIITISLLKRIEKKLFDKLKFLENSLKRTENRRKLHNKHPFNSKCM